ncbi:beta-lactamase [Flammeovirgaceae bacterium 311]|nr:beta-lactamase [Flammeovirgaceae bacterium 311]
MKKIVLLLLPVLLLVQASLHAQSKPVKVDLKKLDKYFEQVVRDWEIPGMTVGIVQDGQLIFSKGYGVKEAGKAESPDANTLYAIASNSKAFTSAIIAMLVQEGKLSWNDKVQQYLPYFELYDPYISQQVTIRDLLSHRVGLGTFSGDLIWYKSGLSAEEIIKRVKYLPQSYDFRAGFGYSNLMYITAGEIIAKVTGKSWGENVKERIFEPLGMDRSITNINELEKTGNYAIPHALPDGKTNVPIPWVDWETVGATGGIISSVNDVAKWMIFNLNHGIWQDDTLLTKASRNLMWTPHNSFTVDHTSRGLFNQNFHAYGLGWFMNDYHGNFRVSHTGGYDGMITAVTLLPDNNGGVVVLTNGPKSPIGAVTLQTLDALLGIRGKDWSAEILPKVNKGMQEDTRIEDIKKKRIANTKPSLPLQAYTGTYHADMYGNIEVQQENDELKLKFEHSPDLSASLSHWHYDVWEIKWDQPHAWFTFGTLKFTTDNNMEVNGLEFEVPNDDIFFEELKPKKVKTTVAQQ